jgi:hypothetical protein
MRRGTTTQRAVSVLVAVGLAVGLGAGLAGCTNDPEPAHLPTPTPVEEVTPSPTPTPTPTPTPDAATKPERPEAMDVADSAGAEAVAVYFLQLYGYVYATNDLAEWRELSHPECVFCASVIDNIDASAAAGEWSTGGSIRVESVTAVEVDPSAWYSVVVETIQEPWAAYAVDGSLLSEEEEPQTHDFRLAITRETDTWMVRAVQVDDAPA